MAASVVEMAISRLLKYTRKIITPLVSGIVVTLIGLLILVLKRYSLLALLSMPRAQI